MKFFAFILALFVAMAFLDVASAQRRPNRPRPAGGRPPLDHQDKHPDYNLHLLGKRDLDTFEEYQE